LMKKMRSASRLALQSLSERFSAIAKNLDNKALSTVSGELASVAQMLDREIVATRYLTVPTEDAGPRVRLTERPVSANVGYAAPAEGRVALLRKVLENASGRVNPITVALLAQTVELLRGEPAEEAVKFLVEIAVARRGEIVAQVSAAAELTDAQRTRLTEILRRIYDHPVTLQVQVDPELLGG